MERHLKVGSVITAGNHQWKVCGIHLGAEGQESLIEIENVSHEAGWTGQWEFHPRMFVPEILLRDCKFKDKSP